MIDFKRSFFKHKVIKIKDLTFFLTMIYLPPFLLFSTTKGISRQIATLIDQRVW